MAKSSNLSRVLNAKVIENLASNSSFDRGEVYVQAGRVGALVIHKDSIAATVTGQQKYSVTLYAQAGKLGYTCSCPMGGEGHFCKHCVAVALTWLASQQQPGGAPVVQFADVQAWLIRQPPAMLVELVLECAAQDERLRERLFRQVARVSDKGVDFAAYRRSITQSTHVGGVIDYHEVSNFAAEIREAIEPLTELLKEGYAAQVIELAEYALQRVEQAMNEVDDSDGRLGILLEEARELHLQACRAAPPDPVALARRLFAWELNGICETFYGAAKTYAEILGTTGLSEYAKLVAVEWAKIPALKPGEQGEFSSQRYRVTDMAEALAEVRGDLEALVAIKARDLSAPLHFLKIAELYRDAKQHDQTLAWAERGMQAFAEKPDDRLREFLASEYRRRNRHDDAARLLWEQFDGQPVLGNYQKLKDYAERAGVWPAFRERALALVRAEIAYAAKAERTWYSAPRGASELVEIYLWEGDAEAAWREAQAGGCTSGLWLRLARIRLPEHPEDAAPIFQREAEQLIGQKNNEAYKQAVMLLDQVRELMKRMGRETDWQNYLLKLRVAHKAKRNFMALAARF